MLSNDIIQTSEGGKTTTEGETPIQRSDEPPVTTTNNPTDPKILQTKPHTHQRETRNNVPGQLPAIINPDHQQFEQRRSQQLA